jgi:hypothetical protein
MDEPLFWEILWLSITASILSHYRVTRELCWWHCFRLDESVPKLMRRASFSAIAFSCTWQRKLHYWGATQSYWHLLLSRNTMKQKGTRKITMYEEITEICNQDCFCPAFARRKWILLSISAWRQTCFWYCKSLASVTFELDSKVHRIEAFAFQKSGLTWIIVPKSVEVLCRRCFYNCRSLTSVTFESDSKLQRMEESAFAGSDLTSIIVPKSVKVLCKECFSNC